MPTTTLDHVHVTTTPVSDLELTPPHPPREETPTYVATHKRLVIDEDRPCFICGVRRSDLEDATRRDDETINPFHASDIETHHFPIERSLVDAVDPQRVAQAYPTTRQFKSFIEWIDSEYNMLVLCSACHRTADHAIHKARWQDFIAEKFAKRDEEGRPYQFVANVEDKQQALALDEHIEQHDGTEATVAAEVGGSGPKVHVQDPHASPSRRRRSRKVSPV